MRPSPLRSESDRFYPGGRGSAHGNRESTGKSHLDSDLGVVCGSGAAAAVARGVRWGNSGPALAPATDMTGALRDVAPDVGCLESTAPPILGGDADLDGDVDLDDFVILKQNFGSSPATWGQGDFDGNGVDDLGVFNNNQFFFDLFYCQR